MYKPPCHVKEDEKLGQKQVSKMTLRFVWGHFSRKQTVATQHTFLNIYVSKLDKTLKPEILGTVVTPGIFIMKQVYCPSNGET